MTRLTTHTAPNGTTHPASSAPLPSRVLNGTSHVTQSTPLRVLDVISQTRSALLHGNLRKPYPIITRQVGNWQWMGHSKLFDACGGAATACLGYGKVRIIEGVIAQLREVAVGNELAFRSAISEAFGQALIATTGGHMARVFTCNSGSDATETAVKLAIQYHNLRGEEGRKYFISRKQSYHGSTIFSLSLSGHKQRRETYKPILYKKVSFVSACNEYRGRGDKSVEEYVKHLANELNDEIERVGPDRVAAFIVEPVVGAALGCVPAVPGYLKAMKGVCQRHGVLFIADEVMCGAGRTGTMHAWQQEEGFVPDIQTMGKALSGGYASIGAVLASHEVCRVIEEKAGAFAHGFTFQGQPSTCAAALEVIGTIQDENLLENVCKIGELLDKGLKDELATHKHVGDIRGRGAFWAIEFVKNKLTKEPFELSQNIARRLLQKGLSADYEIYFYTGTGSADGKLGDHIILAPAYDVTEEDVGYIIQTIARLVRDFFDELDDA